MDTDKRIEWIDVAKGIGIILVIMGHTFAIKYSYVLYTFHMPLFFLLSGLFARRHNNFHELLKQSLKKILRPWFVLWLISFCIVILIPEWRDDLSLKGVMIEFYTSNTNLVQNSSLWYLICFFIVTLLFYPLDKLVIHNNWKGLFVILLLISLMILWLKNLLLLMPLPFHRLPFKSDTALVALVFYAMGFYAKDVIKRLVSKLNLYHIFILLILWSLGAIFNGWTNLNSYDFGKIKLFFYPIAFMGIFTSLGIAYKISCGKCIFLKRALAYYGRNSLLIFGFQSLFIRLYLLIFNHFLNLNMELYATNPFIHQIICFLIVAFITSPIIVFIFKKLHQYNIRIL